MHAQTYVDNVTYWPMHIGDCEFRERMPKTRPAVSRRPVSALDSAVSRGPRGDFFYGQIIPFGVGPLAVLLWAS